MSQKVVRPKPDQPYRPRRPCMCSYILLLLLACGSKGLGTVLELPSAPNEDSPKLFLLVALKKVCFLESCLYLLVKITM